MAGKSKIRFEWDHDRGTLLAIRDSGAISHHELVEALNLDPELHGRLFAVGIYVRGELSYGGWFDDTPKGDCWELWEVIDGEPCPLCHKQTPMQYCPQCGVNLMQFMEIGGADQ